VWDPVHNLQNSIFLKVFIQHIMLSFCRLRTTQISYKALLRIINLPEGHPSPMIVRLSESVLDKLPVPLAQLVVYPGCFTMYKIPLSKFWDRRAKS